MRNSSISGETTADKLENDAKIRRAAKIGITLGNENKIVQRNNNSKDKHNNSSIATKNYSMLWRCMHSSIYADTFDITPKHFRFNI